MDLNKQSDNPYAPPVSGGHRQAGPGCYRSGKELVVLAGAELPHRCVKCNAPATMDKPKTYAWHHPGYYLLLLLWIIVYLIAAMIVMKKAKIAVGVCAMHRRRRLTFSVLAFGLVLLGLGLLFPAMESSGSALGVLSGISLIAAIFVANYGTRMLTVGRVSREEARLKGCGEAFLDSLPVRDLG